MDKKVSLKTGLLIGAVLGGVAAYFLTPRTGKENREMAAQKLKELQKMLKDKDIDDIVKEIYGKASDEGKKAFISARNDISERLADMKETIGDVDKGKYVELVDDVIARLQKEGDMAKDHVMKLQDYFLNRWSMAQKMAEDDAEQVAKKATKTLTSSPKKDKS